MLKRFLKQKFPAFVSMLKFIKRVPHVTFDGWGMITTETNPPWLCYDANDDFQIAEFHNANKKILDDYRAGRFVPTQFQSQDFEAILKSLLWRHYIVFQTVLIAANNQRSGNGEFVMVECGVCDGLTVSLAISAANFSVKENWTAYLYDSWGGMRAENLTENEIRLENNYDYLSLDRTKANLQSWSKNLEYIVGCIPSTLDQKTSPLSINWLHIDLNSAMPTLETLNFFFHKILPGGVILLDDYGWKGHADTKLIVDKFSRENNCICIQIPTGQAIIVKGP